MFLIKTIKGSALLTALFIMTLVAIVATAMSTKVQLDIYRTKLILTHDKIYLASQAVTFWALSELNNTKNKFAKADTQGIVSIFPHDMENIYSTVTLRGALYDLQAQYNVNNLENKKDHVRIYKSYGGRPYHKFLKQKELSSLLQLMIGSLLMIWRVVKTITYLII